MKILPSFRTTFLAAALVASTLGPAVHAQQAAGASQSGQAVVERDGAGQTLNDLYQAAL